MPNTTPNTPQDYGTNTFSTGQDELSRLAAIVSSSEDAMIGKNISGMITSWNAGAEKLFGYKADEAIGRPITILIPLDRLDEEAVIFKKIWAGENVPHFETLRITKDRRVIPVSVAISPVYDASGKIIGASKIARDISKLPDARLLSAMKLISDESKEWTALSQEALKSAAEQLDLSANNMNKSYRHLKEMANKNLAHIKKNEINLKEATSVLKANSDSKIVDMKALEVVTQQVEISKELIDSNKQLLDASHKKIQESEESLRLGALALDIANTQALYDTLTKLPNRRLFVDRCTQEILGSRRSKIYSALLFLDLYKFKPVNDGYGHAVGDELLIEVAERLKKSVRDTDTVARLGGDEFVVILTDLDTDKEFANREAVMIAEKIRSSIAMPVTARVSDVDFVIKPQCTASIGATVFLLSTGEPKAALEKILIQSDKAMYQAKKAGGNRIQLNELIV